MSREKISDIDKAYLAGGKVKYTTAFLDFLEYTQDIAQKIGTSHIDTGVLLIAACSFPKTQERMQELGLTPDRAERNYRRLIALYQGHATTFPAYSEGTLGRLLDDYWVKTQQGIYHWEFQEEIPVFTPGVRRVIRASQDEAREGKTALGLDIFMRQLLENSMGSSEAILFTSGVRKADIQRVTRRGSRKNPPNFPPI